MGSTFHEDFALGGCSRNNPEAGMQTAKLASNMFLDLKQVQQ
jgi:hypothetical protein